MRRRRDEWAVGVPGYRWPVALVLIVLLVLGWGTWVYLQYQERLADRLDEDLRREANAIEVLQESYTLAARSVFEQSINTPEVLALLARADRDPSSRDAVRDELERRLGAVYRGLRDHRFRQFHFHLSDGTTLYRFHRPEKFDDDVASHRPSIRRAQEERRRISGFETGRNFHGFRNVFPLEHEGELIGSVELSVPFAALSDVMERDGKRRLFLLMREDAVLGKLFDDRRDIYAKSLLHPDYLVETLDPGSSDPQRLERLAERIDLPDGALHGEPRGLVWRAEEQDRELLFLPLADPLGRPAGYVVFDQHAEGVAELRRDAWQSVLVGALPLGLAMLMLWGLLRNRAAREAEAEQLRRISECMGEGLYVLDRRGRIQLINDRAVELLGRSREELVGRSAHDLFHADADRGDTPEACLIQDHAFAGERYHSRDERFCRPGGECFPVEVTATPLTRRDRVTGAVTIFRDISRQLKTERRLRVQEALFRTMFEATGVGVALLDERRRFRRVNDALVEMLARDRDDLLGRAIDSLVQADERDRLLENCRALACGKQSRCRGEFRYRRGDGAILWVQQHASPLCGLDDELEERFVVLLTDISSRKRYERLLKQERRQMDRVLNSAGEGIIGLEPDGRAAFVNAAARRLTGFGEQDFTGGESVHALLHHHRGDGSAYPAGECPIQATLRDGQERRVTDEVFWRADGESFPVEYVVGPIEDEEAGGAVVVFQDVTERRRMEAELERRATTDRMTGAWNRAHFEDLMREEGERARRSGLPVSLVMFDLDRFKAVNDNFGHAAGDLVLKTLVDRVCAELRVNDRLGRWGGEEFMVLLPDTDRDGAVTMAERLRAAARDEPFETVGRVTISLGVGQWCPGENADTFLSRLDQALYRAKEKGRDRVEGLPPCD